MSTQPVEVNDAQVSAFDDVMAKDDFHAALAATSPHLTYHPKVS